MRRRDDHTRDAGEEPGPGRAYFTDDRGVSPSLSVIETVAEATGRDPTELRPLHDVVDADALDTFVDPDRGQSTDVQRGLVTFRYEGCEVAVYADGRTVVVWSGIDGE